MKINDRYFLDCKTTSSHAATVEKYKDGLVFAWFGGTREGNPDVSIKLQYKDLRLDLGLSSVHYWNPVLFSHKDHLYLFFKKGEFCDRWQTYIFDITNFEQWKDIDKISDLERYMWMEKSNLITIVPAGLNGPVKTRPIVHRSQILCGSSVETRWDWTSYIETYRVDKNGQLGFVKRSRPLVVPKKIYSTLYGQKMTSGIIQPTLWKDVEGTVHSFFRASRGLGCIYHSILGKNKWEDPQETALLNPNSGVDVIYTKTNKFYLIHNPSSTKRSPLMLSRLDKNFEIVDEIEIAVGPNRYEEQTISGEVSYPYMIEDNGIAHIVYTYGRSKIEYVEVDLA